MDSITISQSYTHHQFQRKRMNTKLKGQWQLQGILWCVFFLSWGYQSVGADTDTYHLSLPNTDTGFERFLGLGLAFPHPYYQRPRHKFPVYNRDGQGSLLYGYGGNEVHPYTTFDAVEGLHRK